MIDEEFVNKYNAVMEKKIGTTEKPGPNLVTSATGARIGVFRMSAPVPDMQDVINFGISGLMGTGTICLSLDEARTLRTILDHELKTEVP